jgi:starch synthase
MRSKVLLPGIKNKDVELLSEPNGINLAKLAIQNSDGIIYGSESLDGNLTGFINDSGIPALDYVPITEESNDYINAYINFYDKILENNATKE